MKPVRVVKTFADLAAVLREVASDSAPTRPPPMTPGQVGDAARAFVAYRRNAASGSAPSPASKLGDRWPADGDCSVTFSLQ
jgi:hypothetical protein